MPKAKKCRISECLTRRNNKCEMRCAAVCTRCGHILICGVLAGEDSRSLSSESNSTRSARILKSCVYVVFFAALVAFAISHVAEADRARVNTKRDLRLAAMEHAHTERVIDSANRTTLDLKLIDVELLKYREDIRLKATELGARALIEDVTSHSTTTRKWSSPRCR